MNICDVNLLESIIQSHLFLHGFEITTVEVNQGGSRSPYELQII